MNVSLTAWHAEENCAWCEKSRECVTADFGDGFITAAPLCWKCLQQAVRVRSRQPDAMTPPADTKS